MREKFTALLTCGCTPELKQQVEARAAYEQVSMADFVRSAVLRSVRARKQEAEADAA